MQLRSRTHGLLRENPYSYFTCSNTTRGGGSRAEEFMRSVVQHTDRGRDAFISTKIKDICAYARFH